MQASGRLANLRELRVSGNKLSSLSAEVGSLRKLHRLIADGNLLTSIPGKGWAACINLGKAPQCIGAAHRGCIILLDHQMHADVQGTVSCGGGLMHPRSHSAASSGRCP